MFIMSLTVKLTVAQSSSIQIMDLLPLTINAYDSTGKNIDSTKQTIRFYFKVSDVSQMDSIYFSIGSAPYKSDIDHFNGKCVHIGPSYYIRLSATQVFLAGQYEVYAEIPLEYPYLRSKKYISVQVLDNNNKLTNQLTSICFM